ncbi:RagB/SusD family nutrient uptake outer membrane protein [Pontibacter sp. 13R65]|uniref:RagB/SusD family nutrient uptake outer membrane protein n=1 Tax=Pontibacter sp. 13R65 TaxID=3127458 RepID=UPI00301B831E
MKRYISKIKYLVALACVSFVGCSDLDEEQFGSLSPDNYYKTEEEALSSVVGVYQRMAAFPNYLTVWRLSENGTDEFIIAARTNGGWFDGGVHHEFTVHNVLPQNTQNNGAWGTVFGVIGAANAVMESLEESPRAADLTPLIAETRALRAYAYFYAMDFWGNVPIFTEARINPNNLPTTNTRQEVFNFVEAEMKLAIADLPSIKDVNRASYYPRFTKEAIQAALASVYLNAEVFTGTPRWQDAIEMTNLVINSGEYILEPQFITSFAGNNHTSRELVSSFSVDAALNAGGNSYVRGALHPLHQLSYNLPFAPAGGFSTFEVALERYEQNDVRRNYIIHGPQTYPDGSPLIDPATKQQLVLIPFVDFRNATLDEGYRVLKYIPDGNFVGNNASNDIVLMRYSDVLLTKAEALFRSGNNGEALTLVNQVRRRSNASELQSLTLQDLENERAREFIWEGHRRRDMIRFGSYFDSTWKFKTTTTPRWRGLYPIPAQQIVANPQLKQNPNYN